MIRCTTTRASLTILCLLLVTSSADAAFRSAAAPSLARLTMPMRSTSNNSNSRAATFSAARPTAALWSSSSSNTNIPRSTTLSTLLSNNTSRRTFPFPYHRVIRESSRLFMSDVPSSTSSSSSQEPPSPDPLIVDSAEVLGRVSWLSWWAQVILSVVASVTLVFARNVTLSATSNNNSSIGPGFVLAGTGLIISIVSIFWTWGEARLSRRWKRKPGSTSRIGAANMLRRALRVGISINVVGMAATLVGAQQIVGALAIKVLTQSGIQVTAYGQMPAQLQPLDILVVQANTNTLLSHFCSLVGFLWLTRFIAKLDPPSVEGDVRKRK